MTTGVTNKAARARSSDITTTRSKFRLRPGGWKIHVVNHSQPVPATIRCLREVCMKSLSMHGSFWWLAVTHG